MLAVTRYLLYLLEKIYLFVKAIFYAYLLTINLLILKNTFYAISHIIYITFVTLYFVTN